METVNELRFLFRIQLVGVLFVSKEIFFSSMDTGFGKGKVVVVEHRRGTLPSSFSVLSSGEILDLKIRQKVSIPIIAGKLKRNACVPLVCVFATSYVSLPLPFIKTALD